MRHIHAFVNPFVSTQQKPFVCRVAAGMAVQRGGVGCHPTMDRCTGIWYRCNAPAGPTNKDTLTQREGHARVREVGGGRVPLGCLGPPQDSIMPSYWRGQITNS